MLGDHRGAFEKSVPDAYMNNPFSQSNKIYGSGAMIGALWKAVVDGRLDRNADEAIVVSVKGPVADSPRF